MPSQRVDGTGVCRIHAHGLLVLGCDQTGAHFLRDSTHFLDKVSDSHTSSDIDHEQAAQNAGEHAGRSHGQANCGSVGEAVCLQHAADGRGVAIAACPASGQQKGKCVVKRRKQNAKYH